MDIIRTTTEYLDQPDKLLPVYNENIIVLSSPNKQSENFKWYIDLMVSENGDLNGYFTASTLTILPNPSGYGIIDFHRHIENYIEPDFSYSEKNISEASLENNKKWYIEIKESFDNTSWVYDDFFFVSGGGLGLESFNDKHPYVVGDIINVVQEGTPTNPSYDGTASVTSVVDDYKIEVDKSYGSSSTDPEGGLTTALDTSTRTIDTSGNNIPIFDSFIGVQDFVDFPNWNADIYDANLTTSAKFLSDVKDNVKVNINSNCWLQGYNDGNYITGLQIETNLGTYFVTVPLSVYSAGNQIKRFKIGPKDILDNTEDSFYESGVLVTTPIIDETTTEYTVYMLNGNPGLGTSIISEPITFNIVDECSKYEDINFLFMDRFGCFIPLTFNKVSKKNIENKRQNYYTNYGTFNSTTSEWGYNTYDRGSTSLDIMSTQKVTCNSDWLNEEQQRLVYIMLKSPKVYILDNNNMVAVNITTNTFEEKKKVNDKLINFTISFEYAQHNRNQRG